MGIPTVGCDNCDSTVQVQGSLLPASACPGQLIAGCCCFSASRFCLSRVSFRAVSCTAYGVCAGYSTQAHYDITTWAAMTSASPRCTVIARPGCQEGTGSGRLGWLGGGEVRQVQVRFPGWVPGLPGSQADNPWPISFLVGSYGQWQLPIPPPTLPAPLTG
jgi:hypothetical protein